MNHLELIVRDGTVRIPSIFMFEDYLDITEFLNYASKMNCTVVFENENITRNPSNDDTYVRSKLEMYSVMVGTREFGNSYVRYLGSPEKMNWNNVK